MLAAVTASLLCSAPPALADRGDVLVRFRATADAGDRGDARRAAKVRREHGLPVAGLELADPEPGVTAAEAAARLERDPDVLYAEPDVVRRPSLMPDDRLFGYQWGLHNTGQTVQDVAGAEDADADGPEAWDVTVGAPSVIVAVVDTGVDVVHPDLAPNVWTNPGEVAGNGVDDDANGFADDVRGWDFVEDDASPQDEEGHGTHVAGTVGARGGDGIGVAGTAWRTTLLPLRVLGPDGGSASDLISAYGYAAEAGARVVNLSLGGPDGLRAERDAIASHPEVLFVAAAGNEGANNDADPEYPCNYALANVVCVAASDQFDDLAEFSNFGVRTVDLAAPGVSIASDYPDSRVAFMDGTSMATPHVSGVAALLAAAAPAATVADLRAALLDGADQKLSLAGTTVTGARLNAFGALVAIGAATEPTEQDRSGGSAPPTQTSPPPPSDPPGDPAPPPGDEPPPPGDTAGTPLAPAGPAPPPPDLTAPFARVASVSPARDLGAFVRRRALRVSLRCNEPCAVRVELRRGSRVIARGSATVSNVTGAATVRLRLGARDRARLRRLSAVRLTLRVRATDPAGNARTVSRRVTLRRR